MMLCTLCKITLSHAFCGTTAVFEYMRNDQFCMQNARRVIGMAPAVAKYIATKSMDEAATLVSIEDIPDLEYRDYAQKLSRVYFKN